MHYCIENELNFNEIKKLIDEDLKHLYIKTFSYIDDYLNDIASCSLVILGIYGISIILFLLYEGPMSTAFRIFISCLITIFYIVIEATMINLFNYGIYKKTKLKLLEIQKIIASENTYLVGEYTFNNKLNFDRYNDDIRLEKYFDFLKSCEFLYFINHYDRVFLEKDTYITYANEKDIVEKYYPSNLVISSFVNVNKQYDVYLRIIVNNNKIMYAHNDRFL